jgi:amidophosphoribosyltransferase
MDFPTETELIANKMLNKFEKVNLRQLAEYLGADSVGYLPLEGLLWACEPIQRGFCTACFDGNYSSSQNTDLRKGIC